MLDLLTLTFAQHAQLLLYWRTVSYHAISKSSYGTRGTRDIRDLPSFIWVFYCLSR